MQVWNVLNAARWKCRTQKIAKKSPSVHHCTTLLGHIFATKARIDNRKNLLRINIPCRCPNNIVNFGLLAAEIDLVVWGTPANFNGFRVLGHYCTAVKLWASAKLCGVEQRAPPMFDRATIRLGIGPHSSCIYFLQVFNMKWNKNQFGGRKVVVQAAVLARWA